MALADPKFTLDGWFQFCWAAFDLSMTVVPLKVALGFDKFDFWEFQKNNHDVTLDTHLRDYILLMPKNLISPILKQLLMVPLSRLDQKLPKKLNPTI